MTRSASLVGAMLVLIAGLTGCASSDDPSPGAERPEVASTPDATTSTRPPTLGEALKGIPRLSPEATVRTLYYYAQWGNYPGIVRLYDPRVRKAIGSSEIAAVYSLNRDALALMKPRIVDKRKTRDGTFVAVELTRREGQPVYDSFLLREASVGWGVGYDTFFDRGYGEYARLAVDGPLRTKPTKAGVLAARDASARFRSLFLPER